MSAVLHLFLTQKLSSDSLDDLRGIALKIVDKRNNLGYIHRGKIVGRISRKIIHLVDTYI